MEIITATALALLANCLNCSGWSDIDQAGAGIQHGKFYLESSIWIEDYEGKTFSGQQVWGSIEMGGGWYLSGSADFGDYKQQTIGIIRRFK